VSGGGTIFNGRCVLHESRDCVFEELLITLTEITLSAAVLSVQANSVFHTPAATYIKVAAKKALIAKILLLAGKGPLFTADGEFL